MPGTREPPGEGNRVSQNAGLARAPLPAVGTVLGFDFGTRRIGVAVGDLSIRVAHPLTTLHGEANDARFAAIDALIREWQPVALVVGLPLHMDGTRHATTALAEKFARRLQARFGLSVALVDERLSSVAAAIALNQAGVRGRAQRAVRDQVAAQEILQAFFDADRRHASAA